MLSKLHDKLLREDIIYSKATNSLDRAINVCSMDSTLNFWSFLILKKVLTISQGKKRLKYFYKKSTFYLIIQDDKII